MVWIWQILNFFGPCSFVCSGVWWGLAQSYSFDKNCCFTFKLFILDTTILIVIGTWYSNNLISYFTVWFVFNPTQKKGVGVVRIYRFLDFWSCEFAWKTPELQFFCCGLSGVPFWTLYLFANGHTPLLRSIMYVWSQKKCWCSLL